jgi:hypothetical protein
MGQFLATHPRVLRICVWATYSFVMYFIWLFASWIVQGYGVFVGILIILGGQWQRIEAALFRHGVAVFVSPSPGARIISGVGS